jgi:hypothetical protein
MTFHPFLLIIVLGVVLTVVVAWLVVRGVVGFVRRMREESGTQP